MIRSNYERFKTAQTQIKIKFFAPTPVQIDSQSIASNCDNDKYQLDHLIDIAHGHISTMNITSPFPIIEVLPSDIMSYILSFQSLSDLYNSKQINKEWNLLSNQNEKKYFINLQRQLDQDCPIPTQSAGQTGLPRFSLRS